MHDEAHDSLEVVAVERHLGLLRHVHVSGMPGPLAVTETLYPLAAIGRLKCVHSPSKTEANR